MYIHNNTCYSLLMCTLLDVCVLSLRRGSANLLCIAPILTDDHRRESNVRDACFLCL